MKKIYVSNILQQTRKSGKIKKMDNLLKFCRSKKCFLSKISMGLGDLYILMNGNNNYGHININITYNLFRDFSVGKLYKINVINNNDYIMIFTKDYINKEDVDRKKRIMNFETNEFAKIDRLVIMTMPTKISRSV